MAAASTVQTATRLVAEVVWLVLLACALAGVAAFLYRWYVREEVPAGLPLLVGLAGVAAYLTTSRALGQVVGEGALPTEREVALFNVVVFALATGGVFLGRRVGDRLGADVAGGDSTGGVDRDVGRLVETVGRVVAVELPGEIEDVVGYDPVPAGTKDALAGRTFLFPKRLTVAELRERLVSRLTADYAVGTVDVDLAPDGTVEYLALGSRAAGIGPTLPPETNAVAVRADPAFSASAGDLVQVWETDPPRRLLTAELRGVADDVVTLAIDAADTTKVNPHTEYRLVTLPVGDRPDREFASLLRAADETFSSVVVSAGSPLHGLPVGALDVAVSAVRPEDGRTVALPGPDDVLTPGDRAFAIARPEALRRLEAAAEPLEPASAPGVGQPGPPGTPAATDADGSADAGPEPAAADAETRRVPGEPDPAAADAADDGTVDGRADASASDELETESESGGADWADENGPAGQAADDPGPVDAGDATEGDDDLSALDTDGEDTAPGAGGDEEGLLSLDDTDDDLLSGDDGDVGALDLADADLDDGFDDVGDGEPGVGDTGTASDHGDEVDDESDGDEAGDESDASSGKSFQELKEEFESGEADWEDDVSDSPGGDMRLDE